MAQGLPKGLCPALHSCLQSMQGTKIQGIFVAFIVPNAHTYNFHLLIDLIWF